jgi:hypothetical protein
MPGEVMPFPDLPNAEYKVPPTSISKACTQHQLQGVVDIDGSVCSYWRFSDFSDLIHIYMDAKTGGTSFRCACVFKSRWASKLTFAAPRRLVQEYVNAQQAIPMLTYDYLNVNLGPQVQDDVSSNAVSLVLARMQASLR